MKDAFRRIASKISYLAGTSRAFVLAILIIIIWAWTGPLFDFSDTWQLVINTGTTIITFLMVFLIQNTQNREGKAMQIKLDELLKAMKGARTSMVNIEELSDDELDKFHDEFQKLQHRYATALEKRKMKIPLKTLKKIASPETMAKQSEDEVDKAIEEEIQKEYLESVEGGKSVSQTSRVEQEK